MVCGSASVGYGVPQPGYGLDRYRFSEVPNEGGEQWGLLKTAG